MNDQARDQCWEAACLLAKRLKTIRDSRDWADAIAGALEDAYLRGRNSRTAEVQAKLAAFVQSILA